VGELDGSWERWEEVDGFDLGKGKSRRLLIIASNTFLCSLSNNSRAPCVRLSTGSIPHFLIVFPGIQNTNKMVARLGEFPADNLFVLVSMNYTSGATDALCLKTGKLLLKVYKSNI
jgi:hypothetical protein